MDSHRKFSGYLHWILQPLMLISTINNSNKGADGFPRQILWVLAVNITASRVTANTKQNVMRAVINSQCKFNDLRRDYYSHPCYYQYWNNPIKVSTNSQRVLANSHGKFTGLRQWILQTLEVLPTLNNFHEGTDQFPRQTQWLPAVNVTQFPMPG